MKRHLISIHSGPTACSWPLEVLRQEVARASLLPDCYAAYRPLLADALVFFLQRLSPWRLERILSAQNRLSASTTIAERLVALLHHLPVLHKVGQVVARARRLDSSFRQQLQKLESLEPGIPISTVIRLLHRECRGWQKAGIQLAEQPLAEGSVAIVLPFLWNESRHKRSIDGVFKLLKPGIKARLDEDLHIWCRLGEFLDEQCEYYGLPQLDYQETFETVRNLLVHEVQLDQEQSHLAQAARDYAGSSSVIIPELLPFCSERLTAMRRLPGQLLNAWLLEHRPGTSNSPRWILARTIIQALIAEPVFSRGPEAQFHADPHAGNLVVTSDGRLGILDWSLAGRLPNRTRTALVQLLIGGIFQDIGQMERALRVLVVQPGATQKFIEVLRAGLRALRWGALPGVGWVTQLFDQLLCHAEVKFTPELLLFRKTLLTLEGVLSELAEPGQHPDTLQDTVLAQEFMRHLFREWPERFQLPFTSRALATHLSTSDLLAACWTAPAGFGRFWANLWQDLLGLQQ